MTPPHAARTQVLPATSMSIRQAAHVLRAGRLVAVPTETVYGLAGDAGNPVAVRAIFAAKGRPADHPVIVHLADAAQLDQWAVEIPPAARLLAAAFWPGPLTIVLKRSPRASDLVTGGLDTVGLRVPAHSVARALLVEFGGAIAAPSANRFGNVSPTRAAHVLAELEGRVEIILDAGQSQVGLESTIVDLSRGAPTVLRPGGITAEQIAAALSQPLSSAGIGRPRVSGSLASHYAPRARVELVAADEMLSRAAELSRSGQKVALLVRGGPPANIPERAIVIPLPETDEALAHELYAALRQVDASGCDAALAIPPAETGLGAAIADRLRRAAGPR